KARLLDVALMTLLDGYHDSVPVYGSGGFTNFDDTQLERQLRAWTAEGLPAVKIKVGTDPADDPRRVGLAREIIGDDVGLFVDGNGAYVRKQALALAESFAAHDVRWFEEPVSSDDVAGLRLLRDRAPAGMEIAAGEYGRTSHISEVCSQPEPSTACRPTSPAAAGSPVCSASRRSATPPPSICPLTAHPRSAPMC